MFSDQEPSVYRLGEVHYETKVQVDVMSSGTDTCIVVDPTPREIRSTFAFGNGRILAQPTGFSMRTRKIVLGTFLLSSNVLIVGEICRSNFPFQHPADFSSDRANHLERRRHYPIRCNAKKRPRVCRDNARVPRVPTAVLGQRSIWWTTDAVRRNCRLERGAANRVETRKKSG